MIINEESEYRSGPQLVSFFNNLGFNDEYQQGFPSRKAYTQEKLERINGTPEIDKCIKTVFNPINFIEDPTQLQELIDAFNKYLAFDGWMIIRQGKDILIKKANFDESAFSESVGEITEQEFLAKDFGTIEWNQLNIENALLPVIKQRVEEISTCLKNNAALSVIFLCGSTLEGLLLNVARVHPREFNTSASAPLKDQKVKPLQEWTLDNLINVAYEVGFIDLDVKKFSHVLRDFRNYIHPYEQMARNFNPTIETAKISAQVLKAAISQLGHKL
ncbi:hypothetical protein [uncultured Fibrobacter sp.]|uniref:hypothetical protein n=1 Tax=uncultured Fibrobacter sp. TaxID=261512 RepID=UPI002591DDDE|nr:hypothetical protein [uncultured Fibrobacter sp.]